MSSATRRSAYELEQEARETRRRLGSTLDDLADNLTPGRLVDEVLTYSRGGGASFLKGLGNSASQNPLPTMLIGLGAAMFLSGRGSFGGLQKSITDLFKASNEDGQYPRGHRPVRSGGDNGAAAKVGGVVSDAMDYAGKGADAVAASAADAARAARVAVRTAAGAASDAAETIRDRATSLGQGATELASAAAEGIAQEGAYLLDKGQRLGSELGGELARLAREQPLVVAAAGLALGAAVAALIPRTKVEDEMLGDASDAVKHAAGDIAAEGFEKVSTTASTIVEGLKKTAQDQNLTPEAVASVVRDAGDKIKETVSAGADVVKQATGKM
jgi:hypothetical protein